MKRCVRVCAILALMCDVGCWTLLEKGAETQAAAVEAAEAAEAAAKAKAGVTSVTIRAATLGLVVDDSVAGGVNVVQTGSANVRITMPPITLPAPQ